MFGVPLHVGVEHPSFVWILAALLGGFGVGFLVRTLAANRDASVEVETAATEE